MTRDEILNMPAGEEIDALVSKEVMGTGEDCRDCDGSDCSYWGRCWECEQSRRDGHYGWHPHKLVPFPYSTDIAAAWEVVEFLRLRFWSTNIVCWDFSDRWVVTCEHRTGHGEPKKTLYADANTAPLAICRAALLAVMEAE